MSELLLMLATVRGHEPRGLAMAELALRTVRVGFPTAEIIVQGNGLTPEQASQIQGVAESSSVDGVYGTLGRTAHDAWIERIIEGASRPFWICDTDVVFFQPVESWFRGNDWTPLAGRYEPEFLEPWSKSVHVARLHTCLMYINPMLLRVERRRWQGQFPGFFGTCRMDLGRQTMVPARERVLFYDTMAGYYQAGIGTPFTRDQDLAFEHLHCGSYGREIAQALGWTELEAMHEAVLADPAAARGLHLQQKEWYDKQRLDVRTPTRKRKEADAV